MKTKKLLALAMAGVIAFGVGSAAATTETFTEWLDRYEIPAGQRGFHDNPAGDGISNLIKYALGLAPTMASRDGLPEPEMVAGRLRLTVEKNPQAVGIDFEVVAVSALGEMWTTDGLDILLDDSETLIVEDTTGADRRFLRLQISPPPIDLPDAYLYVVGGRVLSTTAENVDEELDSIHFSVNARSILVADVDMDEQTIGNWRRGGMLPTEHPESIDPTTEEPYPLHWLYIHNSVHVHNGRLYVGSSGNAGGGSAPADFVAWADVDPTTGLLSEFSTSGRLPGENNQRIGATAIAEVDGAFYYYILGGSSDTTQTNRIVYAPIDGNTGAIGDWQVSSIALPAADWFNASVGYDGNIIHTSGNLRGQMAVDVVTPDTGGNITSSWTSWNYSWDNTNRWDHALLTGEVEGDTFVYAVAGVGDFEGTTNAVQFAPLEGGSPPVDELWNHTDPLPDVRRRLAGASFQDMLVVPGGSTDTTFANAQNTVFIGNVGANGEVEWTTSAEPLFQARSFHGAAIAPAAQE